MSDKSKLKGIIRSSSKEKPVGYGRYGPDDGIWRPVHESYSTSGMFLLPEEPIVNSVRIDTEVAQESMLEECIKITGVDDIVSWLQSWGYPVDMRILLPQQAILQFAAEIRWLMELIQAIRAVEHRTEDEKEGLLRLRSWFVEDRKSGIWPFLRLPLNSFNDADVDDIVWKCIEEEKDLAFMTFKPTACELKADTHRCYLFNQDLDLLFDVRGITAPVPTFPILRSSLRNNSQELLLRFARSYVQECLNPILAGISYRIDWIWDESRALYIQAASLRPFTQVQAIGLALARKLTDYSEVRWCPHPDCKNQIHGRKDKKHCGLPKCAKWVNRNGK